MATEEYAIGYEEGHQAGWNAAMNSLPAQQEQEPVYLVWMEAHSAWLHTDKDGFDKCDPENRWLLYTSPLAPQEPVATDWERIARVQDAKLRAMCNESGGFEKLCEVMDRYEHTSPPTLSLAQQDIQRLTALVRAQQITIDKLEAQLQARSAETREKNT